MINFKIFSSEGQTDVNKIGWRSMQLSINSTRHGMNNHVKKLSTVNNLTIDQYHNISHNLISYFLGMVLVCCDVFYPKKKKHNTWKKSFLTESNKNLFIKEFCSNILIISFHCFQICSLQSELGEKTSINTFIEDLWKIVVKNLLFWI